MIDTHCHIDLYKNPLQIAKECEREGIFTIGVTNLPSHFEMGYKHIKQFKKVRLALGMHPLYAEFHHNEFDGFIKNIANTSYIGEIGLDFSKEGKEFKETQVNSFRKILSQLSGKKKLLSIHSRGAEKEVLKFLIEYNIKLSIFHWYSGSIKLIDSIVNEGYYFSINPAMIKSKSGQAIINRIPSEKILTESDGPFIEIENRPIKPKDVFIVLKYLSSVWGLSMLETENQIQTNFISLINKLK